MRMVYQSRHSMMYLFVQTPKTQRSTTWLLKSLGGRMQNLRYIWRKRRYIFGLWFTYDCISYIFHFITNRFTENWRSILFSMITMKMVFVTFQISFLQKDIRQITDQFHRYHKYATIFALRHSIIPLLILNCSYVLILL